MSAKKGNKYALNNDGGAPKTGIDILWDGWQYEILEEYKRGASDEEIRALIADKCFGKTKASYTLWDRWLKEEEEFNETIKMGRMLSQSWWLKMGRENIRQVNTPGESNVQFSFTGWYMNMKNRFGWKDKVENEHTGEVTSKVLIVELPKKVDA